MLAPCSAEALFSLSEEDTEFQLPFCSEGGGVGFKAKLTQVLQYLLESEEYDQRPVVHLAHS